MYHICLFVITVQLTWGQPILDTSTHNIALTSGNAAVLSCQVSNLGDAAKVNNLICYGKYFVYISVFLKFVHF